MFLDFSDAIDTVDYNVLFSRWKYMLGLIGKVLEWFESYLKQAPRECPFVVFCLMFYYCYFDVPHSFWW